MTSSLTIKNESPYRKYTRNPREDLYPGDPPYGEPLTIIDRDGCILYENHDGGLLNAIIMGDDVEFLERYFTIAPWAVPSIPAPSDKDELLEYDDYFQLAAWRGALDVLKMLLTHATKDMDPTQPIRFRPRQYEILHEAAKWGNIEVVQFLLNNQPLYADIHEQDYDGLTPILSAADVYSRGDIYSSSWEEVGLPKHEAMMNLLLDWGACASDVFNAKWNEKRTIDTVLHMAVEWAGPKLIKRLIDSGADIHAKVTKDSWTLGFFDLGVDDVSDVNALCVACLHGNPRAVRTLIDCRGDEVDAVDMICSRDSHGDIPLHWATRHRLRDGVAYVSAPVLEKTIQALTEVIEILLEIDPSIINTQDNDGNTPLHYVATGAGGEGKLYSPIIKILCNEGANAGIRNKKGETPLHNFLSNRSHEHPFDTDAMATLLAHGAKVTDADEKGDTPLHIVVMDLRQLDAVSFLLQRGANPATRNSNFETCFHAAALGGVFRIKSLDRSATEKTNVQEKMLSKLVEVGGPALMDLPNAEGKSARQICQERRKHWKDQEDRSWLDRNGWGRGHAPWNRTIKL
ncbi:hypothetical protein F53441_13729 [Fusarium austroafricanum]|uniref:Ankyrin n=1 Tax=Fusarium austroafricanum TaxID=2364996 RepID=A0A8H4JKN3_9HYPO|nr:hypothetical protein F53441_13729 [Fusarium austroafricanum]